MESRRHVEQWGVWNTANQRRGKLPFQTRGTVLRVFVTHSVPIQYRTQKTTTEASHALPVHLLWGSRH